LLRGAGTRIVDATKENAMTTLKLEQAMAYDRDGFVLIKDLFSVAEVSAILAGIGTDGRVAKHQADLPDSEGRSSKLSIWSDIGDDIFGAVSAGARLVSIARMLLREDLYHWHSKIMMKEPRVGGAWEWHQDYGYWYNDGCLYPRLISCMVALDAATRENGCLKVIPGSHLLGRLEHGGRGKQAGADPERIEAVLQRCAAMDCEMPPGSVLFFHSNLLHASAANTSELPRRAYICCYNALSNVPYGGKGHGAPAQLQALPDEVLLRFVERAGVQ
jgi:ectoine hydroxylase